MTCCKLTIPESKVEHTSRWFAGNAAKIPSILRRLTVSLPCTSEFCCENCGGGREKDGSKPLNSR
jgi:hypothetical protein